MNNTSKTWSVSIEIWYMNENKSKAEDAIVRNWVHTALDYRRQLRNSIYQSMALEFEEFHLGIHSPRDDERVDE